MDDAAVLADDIVARIRAWQRAIDVHDDLVASGLGVNRTDLRCLDAILELGDASAGEVGELARLSPATTTDALTRLERAGLVDRRRDPKDRRRVLVRPTETAVAAAQRAYGPIAEGGRRVLRALPSEHAVVIQNFLRQAQTLQEEATQSLRGA